MVSSPQADALPIELSRLGWFFIEKDMKMPKDFLTSEQCANHILSVQNTQHLSIQ